MYHNDLSHPCSGRNRKGLLGIRQQGHQGLCQVQLDPKIHDVSAKGRVLSSHAVVGTISGGFECESVKTDFSIDWSIALRVHTTNVIRMMRVLSAWRWRRRTGGGSWLSLGWLFAADSYRMSFLAVDHSTGTTHLTLATRSTSP